MAKPRKPKMTDAERNAKRRALGIKLYRVEWRGTVTRDAGAEEVQAMDKDDARGWYEASYPMRQVTAVSLID